MLVSISYKNWPSVVYIKYNNIKVTNELFEQYKKDIKKLIDKIIEDKKSNKDNMYVVLNIDKMKNINLKYADKQSKFYDYIVKNIRKHITHIYLIVKNKQIKLLVQFYLNLKYSKDKKIFSICKTKEIVQNKLNKLLNKKNSSSSSDEIESPINNNNLSNKIITTA